MQNFKEMLVSELSDRCVFEQYYLADEDIAQVDIICKEKYSTWDWNYGYSPKYSISKKRRIEGCGSIELSLNVVDGKIEEMQILGDFFGNGSLNELTQHLKGCKCKEDDLLERLSKINLQWYVHKLTPEQFVDLILQ